jgi:hypothetical protein
MADQPDFTIEAYGTVTPPPEPPDEDTEADEADEDAGDES